MNSKEALDKLFMVVDEELLYEQCGVIFATELTKVIEQDLDRLEKLKKALNILKENLFIEFDHDGVYLMVKFKEDKEQECDYTIMLLDNKEEFNHLKEVLENV